MDDSLLEFPVMIGQEDSVVEAALNVFWRKTNRLLEVVFRSVQTPLLGE